MIIIYLCIFFLGASLASYINATVYRIEKKIKYPDILTKSSYCENCKKQLTWTELIPIIGYLFIKGECPKCKEKIDTYYPLSETILGLSFLLFFVLKLPFHLWITIIFLFIMSYYDILYRGVPKSLVHIFLLFSLVIFILFNLNIYSVVVTLLIISLPLLLSYIIKKSFGFGDILILLGIGLILPFKSFILLFWLSIFTALLYAILYALLKKKKLRGIKIPMVPFFMFSFIISSMWGVKMFDILLHLLGIVQLYLP